MSDKELGQGRTCFIIGPIGDRLEPPGTEGRLRYENATQMWEKVFEPACGAFGLTPVRADKIAEPGEIPEQIFTYLRDADVVIADVTGGNANVMYELGLRHTRDKVTIQIGEHERLPFDVNTIRTVKFRRTEAGLIDAREALVEALRAGMDGDGRPVNATRIWNELAGPDAQAIAEASALSYAVDDPMDQEDEEGPGRLDLLATGEEALTGISETLQIYAGQLNELGSTVSDATPDLENAGGFAARLTIIRQLAERLRPVADGMDETSDKYFGQIEQINSMIGVVLETLTEDPDQIHDENVGSFLASVVQMSRSADEASVMMTSSLHQVRDMRRWSNQLRSVSRSLEHSLNTILRGNAIVTSWADSFRELPDWVEPPSEEEDQEDEETPGNEHGG